MNASKLYKIGSGQQNQIIVRHDSVAETHAEIFVDRFGNAFLTDLRSGAPTKVNGELVSNPVHLSEGEEVTVGRGILIDWEKLIFNRVRSVKKVQSVPQVTNTTPKPVGVSSKHVLENKQGAVALADNVFMRNLDLVLIYGGVLLMWFVITLLTG
jgi:pSer/pThr/pTyr-binding forkhead associated (FHA) protein